MDPDDPDHSQNLITSSFYHFGHILKILSKSVDTCMSCLVHKQTKKQTDKPRQKHNLLGGDNKLKQKHMLTEICICRIK